MRILITEIGSKNSGDESICLGAARRLLALGTEVTFCSRVSLEVSLRKAGLNVKHVSMPIDQKFEGIDDVNELIGAFAEKMPELYQKMCQALLNHDLVAVTPGGRFTDGYKNARTLLTPAVAQMLGKPVIILHQSVGPIEKPDHKKLLTDVLKKCRLILIRDDRSLEFLKNLGIPAPKMVLSRDVAFGEFYPTEPKIDYDLGLNIRYGFNGHVNHEILSSFIRSYNDLFPNDRILIYSTTYNLPPELVDYLSVLPCHVQSETPSFPHYLKAVGRCAINIADSFHGCIFSMMADRPVVCCQTDFKTWKLEGLPAPDQEVLEVLPGLVSRPDAEALLTKVIAVRENPGPTRQYQRRIVEYGREMCERGWTVVEESLSRMQEGWTT